MYNKYVPLFCKYSQKNPNPRKNFIFQAFSHFYFCTLVNRTTHSTCAVLGNRSTGVASSTSYPSSLNTAQSRASVAGSQETYTILSGAIFAAALIVCSEQPLRGGSRTITSGRLPSPRSFSAASPASAQINRAFSMPFAAAFFFASSIAGATVSMPISSSALSAIESPIVPAPQ